MITLPDISIDYHIPKEELIAYLKNKYGSNKVSLISFQEKNSMEPKFKVGDLVKINPGVERLVSPIFNKAYINEDDILEVVSISTNERISLKQWDTSSYKGCNLDYIQDNFHLLPSTPFKRGDYVKCINPKDNISPRVSRWYLKEGEIVKVYEGSKHGKFRATSPYCLDCFSLELTYETKNFIKVPPPLPIYRIGLAVMLGATSIGYAVRYGPNFSFPRNMITMQNVIDFMNSQGCRTLILAIVGMLAAWKTEKVFTATLEYPSKRRLRKLEVATKERIEAETREDKERRIKIEDEKRSREIALADEDRRRKHTQEDEAAITMREKNARDRTKEEFATILAAVQPQRMEGVSAISVSPKMLTKGMYAKYITSPSVDFSWCGRKGQIGDCLPVENVNNDGTFSFAGVKHNLSEVVPVV